MLASAMFLMPFSKLADQYGRRLIFMGGVLVFGLSCVGLFLAGSYVPLVIFRVTQGFGGSMIFSTSAALVTLAFPPERRGYAMGINVASAYLGQATGPIFGGIIVYNIGWRSLFLITACLAFLALVLDVWLLGRAEWKEERGSGLDRVGSVTYALALSAFLLGLSWVPLTRGVVLFVAGVLGLVFFFYWESRAKNPLIQVSLYRHNRVFALSNLTALISYSSIWAMSYLISLYLQFIKGLNAETGRTRADRGSGSAVSHLAVRRAAYPTVSSPAGSLRPGRSSARSDCCCSASCGPTLPTGTSCSRSASWASATGSSRVPIRARSWGASRSATSDSPQPASAPSGWSAWPSAWPEPP